MVEYCLTDFRPPNTRHSRVDGNLSQFQFTHDTDSRLRENDGADWDDLWLSIV
jgi:hypothetical protein